MGDPITDRLALVEHIGYLRRTTLFDELSGHEQLDYIRGLRDLPLEPTKSALRASSTHLTSRLHRPPYCYILEGDPSETRLRPDPVTAPTCFFSMNRQGLDPRAARTLRTMIDDLADGNNDHPVVTHPADRRRTR